MSSLVGLMNGLVNAMQPITLLYCFIGVLSGIIIGALPGLGPSMGIAILLPLTYGMDATAGIVMLAGIYYGAMYGGSISSILINTPGDSAAVVTTFDGYPMATKKGRPAQALGMAAFASILGGTIALVGFVFLAPIIAKYALVFSSMEYAALYIMGLTAVAGMTSSSVAKAFFSCLFGLFVGTIGLDAITGTQRFVFGVTALFSGIDFIPVAMGLFGVAEIISVRNDVKPKITRDDLKLRKLLPSREDWHYSLPHIFRGSILGFFIGILPGAGATIATFLSYDMAKRTARRKELFGTGVPEGIAAPESSNNAACIGAMIPMLTLGVPGSGSTAVMMGALLMFGMTPGPYLFTKNADFAWTLCASMYVGNVIMLLLVIVALPLFIQIVKVKNGILNAIVMGLILIGSYAMNNSMTDVCIVIVFGVIGYIFKKLSIPLAPMVLALVLGYNLETAFRQSMTICKGNIVTFVTRPMTAVILIIAVLLAFGKPIGLLIRKVIKAKQ